MGHATPPEGWDQKRGYRHFSGSKAFDFPEQDGLFPVQQRSESRGVPTLGRKFWSKAVSRNLDDDPSKFMISMACGTPG